MGGVYNGIHKKIALGVRDSMGIEALVETGTGAGNTAEWAKDEFEKVITIEISHEYFERVEKRLLGTHNVLMVLGDSREWLEPVCRGRSGKPTLFWLDAHYSALKETYDPKGCPLFDEIQVINETFNGVHAIMVDDYLALKSEFNIREEDVVRALQDKNRHNRTVIVADDIYFASPNIPKDFYNWLETDAARICTY